MSSLRLANAMVTKSQHDRRHLEKALLQHKAMHSLAHSRWLQSIVVPLDGTHFAEHAIPLACAIAKRSTGLLKLIHVLSPAERLTVSPGMTAFDVFEAHSRLDARQYLDRVRRRIAARFPEITSITHIVESRDVAESLAGLSADLLVIATHGRGWLGRLFFGSVARKAMSVRREPTMYVRGYDCPVDFSADPVPLHVIVALDGRNAANRMLYATDMITQMTGARRTFLHIADADEYYLRSARRVSETALLQVQRQLSGGSLERANLVTRIAANPTEGILSFVEETHGDVIIVSSPRGPEARGSTAGRLIRRSTVPVIVIRE